MPEFLSPWTFTKAAGTGAAAVLQRSTKIIRPPETPLSRIVYRIPRYCNNFLIFFTIVQLAAWAYLSPIRAFVIAKAAQLKRNEAGALFGRSISIESTV
jgi:hypothetical protein